MTPRQRAEGIVMRNRSWSDGVFIEEITSALQAESNAELERGRARTATVQAALKAALEDLAKAYSALTSEQIAHGKTMRERDGLAERLRYECPDCCGTGAVETLGPDDGQVELMACARCGPAYDELAAHDRAVAARVLREARRYVDDCSSDTISEIADEYRRGEREVPHE